MHIPKYRALADDIRNKIASGIYKTDKKLDTEEHMTRQYQVSRHTVRQALNILEQDGLISRRQGSGTYAEKVIPARSSEKRIGVIATFITDYIFPSILRGIESTLSGNGYAMELVATNNRIETERRVLTDFLHKPIGGLLVEGTKTALPNPNISLYRQLQEKGLPIVFYNSCYPGLDSIVSVTPDEEAGSAILVRHLISKGCKQIGGLFKSDDEQGMKRYYGYIQACLSAEMTPNDSTIIWHNSENKRFFLDSYRTGELRKTLETCDGFVCYNDEIAVYLEEVLMSGEMVRMPYIASFDNSILRQVSEFPFASLAHPKEILGMEAAIKLIHIINGQKENSLLLPWMDLAE